MLKLRYSIYKFNNDGDIIYVNDSPPLKKIFLPVTYDTVSDVAAATIKASNKRLDNILKAIVEETDDKEAIQNLINKTLENYTIELSARIEKHFQNYLSQQMPIDQIPDFECLDGFYIHIFCIHFYAIYESSYPVQ